MFFIWSDQFALNDRRFYIFNHVNFDEASVAGNFAKLSTGQKGSFGALTTALDPRIGQLALKVIF